jgi:AbrB family transcriptional regulator, transcriptional pleiotropic regulator of transition state genes
MKTLGARKLDLLGRITLPMELRKTLGLVSRAKVDMWIENNSICMKFFDKNNPKGISRPIDDLGRVTIPMEFRESFHMKEREILTIYLDGPIIHFKTEAKCVFCGGTKDLIEKNKKYACSKCINELIQEEK